MIWIRGWPQKDDEQGGKDEENEGKSILMGAFMAASSARWRRFCASPGIGC